jgi:hypothetical protein
LALVAPGAVIKAAGDHRQSLKIPVKSLEEYLQTLARQD